MTVYHAITGRSLAGIFLVGVAWILLAAILRWPANRRDRP